MNRLLILAIATSTFGIGELAHELVDPPVNLQAASPGSQQIGNINVSGAVLAGTFFGQANGSTTKVVSGWATSPNGFVFGGDFRSASTDGRGVFGSATALSGFTFGGDFRSASTNGRGILGWATASSGTTYGVYGKATSADGFGGYFEGRMYADKVGAGTISPTAALDVTGAAKIEGASTVEFGAGNSGKESNAGKIGYEAFTPGALDIVGAGTSANKRKIKLWAEGGTALNGRLTVNESIYSPSEELRVESLNNAILGVTNGFSCVGTGGQTFDPAGYGMYSNGRMHVAGTLTKTGGAFRIDDPRDPENYYLQHSFVESPDMMNVYNGNVTTDSQGVAWIQMPDWFDVINKDFRYQLTVMDSSDESFALAKIYRPLHNGKFAIKTNQPRVSVSWQVTGIRKDPWAEQNRIRPVEPKNSFERGTYQDPAVYGKPDSMGLFYKLMNRRTEPDTKSPPR